MAKLKSENRRVGKARDGVNRATGSKKSPITAPVVAIDSAYAMRTLCIMLVIQCVVSYRSVPKIINLFNEKADLELPWIPHFTSIINWTLTGHYVWGLGNSIKWASALLRRL